MLGAGCARGAPPDLMPPHADIIDETRLPPVNPAFLRRVFWAFAALVLLSAGLSALGKWQGRAIAMAGHTDDRTVHEIVIGDRILSVPANMIRFERARRAGPAERVDLYLLWPALEGYTHETRHEFNHLDGRRNIVFLSFEEASMSHDMTGRLEPIYRALLRPDGHEGPNGLTVHRFTETSGYGDERLVVGERTDGAPFVARCLSGASGREALAPCERDLHLEGGLALSYRFPAALAGQWRELDAAMVATARRFLRAAR